MANNTLLTDEFVADLLAKEAGEASIKYSSLGLEAFRSAKPSTKAKPNTRFLNRIIKETTNHNDALRAKETAEAQARLESLTEAGEKRRQRLNPTASDIRRRQLGAISSILQGGKRREGTAKKREEKYDADEEPPSKQRRKEKEPREKDGESSCRSRRKEEGEQEPGKHRHHHRHHHRSLDRSRSPAHKERSRRKYRDRSPLSSDEDKRSHHHSKSRTKDRDSHHKRHASSGDKENSEDKSPRASRDPRSRFSRQQQPERHDDEDSDPLDALIGPPPPPIRSPVRVRGRGAIKGPAAMDKRFSEGYDAASDTQMDAEEGVAITGDWDESVELFRERQKWKQQGADRLRAAGFTEEQITKWEKGGEKDVDDVRWTKTGEQREWDRGKGVGDDCSDIDID